MTHTYVITYDLRRPHQDYKGLYDVLKNFETWCHGVDSTWFVRTHLNSEQIRAALLPHVDSNDRLIITRAAPDGAWKGLAPDVSQWLTNNL